MKIIKINSNDFPKGKNILIDTNVIYWLTYASSRVFPRTLKPQPYQLEDYPQLFEKGLKENNKFFYSDYSAPELCNILVRVEASLDGINNKREHKKWLREKGREIVTKELDIILSSLESWATPLTRSIPISSREYHEKYSKVYLDGYDIYINDDISKNNIDYILTDDIDYTSLDNVNVITANKSVQK